MRRRPARRGASSSSTTRRPGAARHRGLAPFPPPSPAPRLPARGGRAPHAGRGAVVAGLDPVRKRRFGKLAYVAEIVAQLARHADRPYRVICAGEDIPVAAAVIANGRYYAGRFVLAPQARLDAPTLELVLFLSG